MRGADPRLIDRLAGTALVCVVSLACSSKPASPAVSIAFTKVPPADKGGPDTRDTIAGRAVGARPGQRVVLFSKSGVWWVQPEARDPYTTIAFQPAPYQAVYGASKAFVLSFSQALWAEARAAGVAVTALCPGPTRTGFVDALGADVGHTAIYRRLADPEPVIEAGLRGLDKGRAVVIPGVRNKVIAESGRFMPREWLTRVSARLLRPASTAPRPPIEVHNEIVIPASAERVWDLLTDVEGWPSWYRACRWVRVEPTGGAARPASFRWKAHPVVLRSKVVAADRPRSFTFVADAQGLHAERTFTLRPSPDGLSTVVVSHETQVGLLPWLGRLFLAPRLRAANQAMFDDLARAAGHDRAATRATPRRGVTSLIRPGTS